MCPPNSSAIIFSKIATIRDPMCLVDGQPRAHLDHSGEELESLFLQEANRR